MEGSRIWSSLGILLVISLAANSFHGTETRLNVLASNSMLAGRWTTSDLAPLGGGGPAAAYDSESDRIVLFGDTDGFGVETETWAYDFNTDRWTGMQPARSPPPIMYSEMAYDAGSDRVILFGGLQGSDSRSSHSLGETWSYDLNTNAWTNLTSAVGPPPRHFAEMAYDAESDRIVLFGGLVTKPLPSSRTLLNDTWGYDFDTNTWTNRTTVVGPPVFPLDMVYDSLRDRIVIPRSANGDVWLYNYDENLWTNRSIPSPYPPCCNRAVYDSRSDRIISYGSLEVPAPPEGSWPGTWVYDIDAGTWDRRTPLPVPFSRQLHVMAYDSESDRVILFGGVRGDLLRDTWAYSLDDDAWTHMDPSPRPERRQQHAMAYDAESDRVVLFGGVEGEFSGREAFNDTWSYDADSDRWTRLSPLTVPPPRSTHVMTYDEGSDRVILFGGTNSGLGPPLSDTWTFDLNTNTWENLTSVDSPGGRYWSAMTYAAKSNKIVLFGGATRDSGSPGPYPSQVILNDTWVYDSSTNTWDNRTPAPSPPAKIVQGAAYDAESDRVVLVLGAFFSPSETWAYDVANNTWTAMVPGFEPPAGPLEGIAYNTEADRILILTGGPWAYDLNSNNWSAVGTTDGPFPRGLSALAYDRGSNLLVLFGGSRATAASFFSNFNDTWRFEVPIRDSPGGFGIALIDVALLLVAAVAVAGAGFVLWRRRGRRTPPAS